MRGRRLKILALLLGIAISAMFLLNNLQPSLAFRAHWHRSTDVSILDYKHVQKGFEDHEHYWRIQLADDDVEEFISANGLKPFDSRVTDVPVNLVSWMNESAPPWWPTTPDKVFVAKEDFNLNALVTSNGDYFLFHFSE